MCKVTTPVKKLAPLTTRSCSLRCVSAAEHHTAEQYSKTGRRKPRKHLESTNFWLYNFYNIDRNWLNKSLLKDNIFFSSLITFTCFGNHLWSYSNIRSPTNFNKHAIASMLRFLMDYSKSYLEKLSNYYIFRPR